jgi:hypothetical protein
VIGAAGAAAFACYPLAGSFWPFLLVLGAETIAGLLANGGRSVYTAAALPAQSRVRIMAFQRAHLNVGFTVGSRPGAAALALNSRAGLLALVLANAAGMVLNAVVVSRRPTVVTAAAGPARGASCGTTRTPRCPWSSPSSGCTA